MLVFGTQSLKKLINCIFLFANLQTPKSHIIFATDFKTNLIINTKKSTIMKTMKIEYTVNEEQMTYNVVVVEDDKYIYVDFLTGFGAVAYPKDSWTIDEALRDQAHIYEENPVSDGDSWRESEDFEFDFDDYDYQSNL